MKFRRAGWLLLLVFFPFLPQVPGCVMSASPKIGRVVDAETGRGMANVAVIAGARFYGGPVLYSSGGSSALYETVVRTDSNGNYFFPPNPLGIRIGLPGTSPAITWVVTAFAPGYALEGDEDSWSEYYPEGYQKHFPRSLAESPPATWLGVAYLEPLRMKKRDLAARDWAMYFRQLFYFDIQTAWNDSTEADLRREARDWIVPLLCKMDADAKLDYTAVATIFIFAVDTRATSLRMIELEPVYGELGHREHSVFRASDACDAMKNAIAFKVN